MPEQKQDPTDNPILEKLLHHPEDQPQPDLGIAPRQPISTASFGEDPQQQIDRHHDTQFEIAVTKAADELQRPTESKSKFWQDHPFAGALVQGLIQSMALSGPGRGPGPGGMGTGAPIARPYYGINQQGQGFPVNPSGRTYTFPSLPVRTTADNFMMSIMNKFERMLGMKGPVEETAASSRASLQGQRSMKDLAQEEEGNKASSEEERFGRVLSPREEKDWAEKGIPPNRPISPGFKKIIQEYRDKVGMEGKGHRKGEFDKPKTPPKEKPITERFAKPGEKPGWKEDTREIVQPNIMPGLFKEPGRMSDEDFLDFMQSGHLEDIKEKIKNSEIEVPEWLGRLDQLAPGGHSQH